MDKNKKLDMPSADQGKVLCEFLELLARQPVLENQVRILWSMTTGAYLAGILRAAQESEKYGETGRLIAGELRNISKNGFSIGDMEK